MSLLTFIVNSPPLPREQTDRLGVCLAGFSPHSHLPSLTPVTLRLETPALFPTLAHVHIL